MKKVKIDTGPLELLRQAHALIQARHAVGKTVSRGFAQVVKGIEAGICQMAGFTKLIAYDAETGEVTGIVDGELPLEEVQDETAE